MRIKVIYTGRSGFESEVRNNVLSVKEIGIYSIEVIYKNGSTEQFYAVETFKQI